ncbi:MAG: molybdopterin converting factor subunit 1 [Alphaproteobacteria bacterium]|nr:molybdopterin converting factor subunit 1 [Alphaproteobacteria bacterium]
MKVLYFAWLKTRAGIAAEEVAPPAEVTTVGTLIDWLKTQSEGHGEALANTKIIRVAVNHEFADFDHPVKSGDEVAFFPPVTGG